MTNLSTIPPANTVEARMALVAQDVARLSEIAPDLPEAALAWVRDGGSDVVLDRIAKSTRPKIFGETLGDARHIEDAARATVIRPGPGFDPAQAGRYYRLAIAPNYYHYAHLPWILERGPAPEPLPPNDGDPLWIFAEAAGLDERDVVAALLDRDWPDTVAQAFGVDVGGMVRRMVRRNKDALYAGANAYSYSGHGYYKALACLAEDLADPLMHDIYTEALSTTAPTDREAVAATLRNADPTARRELGLELLTAKAAAARDGGALVLADLAAKGDEDARAALADHLPQEKAKGVIKRIEVALARTATDSGKDGYQAVDGTWIDLPPVKHLQDEPTTPLSDTDRQAAIRQLDKEWGTRKGDKEKLDHALDRVGVPGPMDLAAEIAIHRSYDRAELSRFMGNNGRVSALIREWAAKQPLKRQIEIALVRAVYPDRNVVNLGTGPMNMGGALTDWLRTAEGDLRVIEAMLDPALDPNAPKAGDQLLAALLADHEDPEELHPDAVWPFLAGRVDELASRLMAARGPKQRARIVTLVSMMPAVPQVFEQVLLDVAQKDVGEGGQMAQQLLGIGTSRWDSLLEGLLRDPDAKCRENAAFLIARASGGSDWDQRLRDLYAAEKKEPVQIAILAARAALGADLSSELGARALTAQAQKGLAKLRTPLPDWLLLEALPPLTLTDGSTLERDVPCWWMAKAIALRRPQGDPLIDLWLGRLSEASAQALGAHVLDAWIAEDTRRRPAEQAADMAQQYAERYLQFEKQRLAQMQANPTGYARALQDYVAPDFETERARGLRRLRAEIVGTAARHTGLLALTARMDDQALARTAAPYLKSHIKRAAQASALIDALAHHAGRNAISTLVAALPGIKKKSLRDKVETCLTTIADERGWSVDELGDRTVATGGLDAKGLLDLPTGEEAERIYTARLGDDLTLVLRNPDGKVVRGLPAGKDDATKESRQAFNAAKKAVPTIISNESKRLRHALATQRCWSGADWKMVFAAHPILRPLSQRLIWITDGTAFRPTPEGEILGLEDEEIHLKGDATVQLAHPITLGAEATFKWAELLAEEEVTQPFDQLHRPVLGVPSGAEKRITTRENWTVPGATLMAAAAKLGWLQGGGGAFLMRQYNVPGAPIRARIDHGYYNSYEDPGRPIRLGALSFWTSESKRRHAIVPLADVPPVLLSECQADLQAMTDAGTAP